MPTLDHLQVSPLPFDGKRLRILHIGNIANNAYQIANLLNKVGYDCDVLCYDYYHIMGCPEWEDADFLGNVDQFHPDWSRVDLRGFKRPEWFAQGPLLFCIKYLVARRRGRHLQASYWKILIDSYAKVPSSPFTRLLIRVPWIQRLWSCIPSIVIRKPSIRIRLANLRYQLISIAHELTLRVSIRIRLANLQYQLISIAYELALRVPILHPPFRLIYRSLKRMVHRVTDLSRIHSHLAGDSAVLSTHPSSNEPSGTQNEQANKPVQSSLTDDSNSITGTSNLVKSGSTANPESIARNQMYSSLAAEFRKCFPERQDQLKYDDVLPYLSIILSFQELFAEYDIIQGYATDPILPLIAAKHPYIALEHGTIRQIPFTETAQGRLTALSYLLADGVIITNCDNMSAAERLKLENYRYIPHMVNERWIQVGFGKEFRQKLIRETQTDFVIFHPARHHWSSERSPNWEKGNDIIILGLAQFFHLVASRAIAIFVDWGQTVAASKALIADLGITERVHWIPVQHNRGMSQVMDASDVVIDQISVGAFGNIPPKAMALGKPTIVYINEVAHAKCFEENPPVINAKTPEQVCEGLTRAYQDHAWYRIQSINSQDWYYKYHSNKVIQESIGNLYTSIWTQHNLNKELFELSHPGQPYA